jgi:hypothetical protein
MQDHTFSEPLLRSGVANLLSALDTYDVASTRLVESWLDMDVYMVFSKQIDAIRDHGVTLPALTVLSLQLVIAHSELVSTLWQNASTGLCATKLQDVKERHTFAVNALRAAAASYR